MSFFVLLHQKIIARHHSLPVEPTSGHHARRVADAQRTCHWVLVRPVRSTAE